jgi:hypothetical protein
MLKRTVVSFFGLSLVSAGLSFAANLPILCNLDYYVSTQSGAISATPRNRTCPVKVIFSNGFGTTSRTYSCVIPAGQTSCSMTVDPAASGVPGSFAATSAYTAYLYSATEEDAGCVYDEGYPSGQINNMMGNLQVIAHHRFDCTSVP